MLIAGLGGNCKDSLIDLINQYGKDNLTFYTDFIDDKNIDYFLLKGLNVISGEDSLKHFLSIEKRFISFLGDNKSRERQIRYIESLGGIPTGFISPNALVDESLSEISDRNVIIMDFSHFSAGSLIEEGSTIYSYTAVAHDVHIGRFVFISAYCAISNSYIDDYTFVGLNTMIGPGVHIGKNCIIGANSYVKNNLPDNSVAFGTPAKIIKKNLLF